MIQNISGQYLELHIYISQQKNSQNSVSNVQCDFLNTPLSLDAPRF